MKNLKVIEKQFARHNAETQDMTNRVHHHEYNELYYMAKGNTSYYIGDKIYYVEEGNFVFIPHGISHITSYQPGSVTERVLVHFYDSLFGTNMQEIKKELYSYPTIHIEDTQLPCFEDMLHKIEEETLSENAYKSALLQLYIMELLAQLCRHKHEYQPVLSGPNKDISLISRYISSHYQEPITLKEISQKFAISESHLSRKFKKHTSIGLSEYITHVRITNAAKLLCETDLSVTQIAQQCGFGDGNYFSTVFSRINGISPQKYRNRIIS